jgi:hypothetical protein
MQLYKFINSINETWWVCKGKIRGRSVIGYGTTAQNAINEALR